MGFAGGSAVKNLPVSAGEKGLIPRLRRSPGEGIGNPLQYSCLKNPRQWSPEDYGPWHCKNVRFDLVTKQQQNNLFKYIFFPSSEFSYAFRVLLVFRVTFPLCLQCMHMQGIPLSSWFMMQLVVRFYNTHKDMLTLLILYYHLSKSHSCLKSSQFSSVAQSCPTLWDPMECSKPGFPVYHQLPELTQTHVHQVYRSYYYRYPPRHQPGIIFPSHH